MAGLTVPTLAATPYTETTLILFLHILAAMALVGGSLAWLLLFERARGAAGDAEARTTIGGAQAVYRSVLVPGGVLVGILGLILMWRYDAKGIFDAGKQTWIHISILLWVVGMGVSGFAGRRIREAVDGTGAGGSASLQERLSRGAIPILVWINALVALVILYFMVFQPFVSS